MHDEMTQLVSEGIPPAVSWQLRIDEANWRQFGQSERGGIHGASAEVAWNNNYARALDQGSNVFDGSIRQIPKSSHSVRDFCWITAVFLKVQTGQLPLAAYIHEGQHS